MTVTLICMRLNFTELFCRTLGNFAAWIRKSAPLMNMKWQGKLVSGYVL